MYFFKIINRYGFPQVKSPLLHQAYTIDVIKNNRCLPSCRPTYMEWRHKEKTQQKIVSITH